MNTHLNNIKLVFAAVGGVLGCIFGGFDALIYALMVFVLIDYITGVLVAVRNKKVSSEIGFKGISKKVMIFLMVAVGNVIDQYIITAGSTLRTMLIMFYLSNEGISIIENAGNLGVPVPSKIKGVLEKLIERHSKDNSSNDTK